MHNPYSKDLSLSTAHNSLKRSRTLFQQQPPFKRPTHSLTHPVPNILSPTPIHHTPDSTHTEREFKGVVQEEGVAMCTLAKEALEVEMRRDEAQAEWYVLPNDRYQLLELPVVVCGYRETPPEVIKELDDRPEESVRFTNRGYLENIGYLYYFVQSIVFWYKIDKNLRLSEPTVTVFEEPIVRIIEFNIATHVFKEENKNVVAIIYPRRLSLYKCQVRNSKIDLQEMGINISLNNPAPDCFLITNEGSGFYMDMSGKIHQILDVTSRYQHNKKLQSISRDPSLIQKMSSKMNQHYDNWGRKALKMLVSMTSEYFSKMRKSVTPHSLVADEARKILFSVVEYRSQLHSQLNICIYSYWPRFQLVRTINEREILDLLRGMSIASYSKILKISPVDPHFLPEGNIEVQLYSGVRVFMYIDSKNMRCVRALYQPDFQTVDRGTEPGDKDFLPTKSPDEAVEVIACQSVREEYICLYTKNESWFESYLESASSLESWASVARVPWTSIGDYPLSDTTLSVLNYSTIINPFTHKLSSRGPNPVAKLNQYVRQLFLPPNSYMMTCSRSLEFAIKLRPLDLLCIVLRLFQHKEAQNIKIQQLIKLGVPTVEMIVMLMAVSCNESVRYWAHSQVQSQLKRDYNPNFKDNFLNTNLLDACETPTLRMRQMASMHLDTLVREMTAKRIDSHTLHEKQLLIRKEEAITYSICFNMYASRILRGLWQSTNLQLNKEECAFYILRLLQINSLMSNNACLPSTDATEPSNRLKYLITRGLQMLYLMETLQQLPQMKFKIMIDLPSSEFEEPLFNHILKNNINGISKIWKENRLVVSDRLMKMAAVVREARSTNRDLSLIQKHVSEMKEIPVFFIEYLSSVGVNPTLKPQNLTTVCEESWDEIKDINRKIQIIQQKMPRVGHSRSEESFAFNTLIQTRKTLKIKHYLINYLSQMDNYTDYHYINNLSIEDIRKFILSQCNKLPQIIFELNFPLEETVRLGKQEEEAYNCRLIDSLVEEYGDHSHEEFSEIIRQLLFYTEPQTVKVCYLLDKLVSGQVSNSTFYPQRPELFKLDKEIESMEWIHRLLLQTGQKQSKIVGTLMDCAFSQAAEFLRHKSELSGTRMFSLWVLAYLSLRDFRPNFPREIEVFKMETEKWLQMLADRTHVSPLIVSQFRKLNKSI